MMPNVRVRAASTAVLSALICLLCADVASGQPAPAIVDPRPLDSVLKADTLADLPLGANVYTVLENTQAEVISDRFNASGLNVGEGARLGGFLGSWSQTLYRIGEINVTDPAGRGAPRGWPPSCCSGSRWRSRTASCRPASKLLALP
jgi:hypothetical protein